MEGEKKCFCVQRMWMCDCGVTESAKKVRFQQVALHLVMNLWILSVQVSSTDKLLIFLININAYIFNFTERF